MNKENAHLYLPLVQALSEGKQLQGKHTEYWRDYSSFDFTMPPDSYRIKPEPKEYWLCGCHYFNTKQDAEKHLKNFNPKSVSIIHVREVLD